ncbi:MBL fold metallo-hydrolase [Fictibacillus sp. WQ 8-8]|uniref:MBL fold metallo-hydrolase n=1 Tax=Fictibacillus sp. WQ 8-8 TaxID=2938788 RepID=UPI00210DC5C7|nr:MBL fold metallo-hydrolase [Fictibacillus sp. WQ 8-8]MCQ6265123.1 MBL fold metallo-hydrolase [Fictibacillus sp. WQ 8-8]
MNYTYFNLDQAADSIYAAISKDGTGSLGNAGFADLGGETVVFDTFLTPAAGEQLRKAAEALTDNKVKYVVNSQWHGDHVYGNQAFEDAVFFGTEKLRHVFWEKHSIDVEKVQAGFSGYLNS